MNHTMIQVKDISIQSTSIKKKEEKQIRLTIHQTHDCEEKGIHSALLYFS